MVRPIIVVENHPTARTREKRRRQCLPMALCTHTLS